MRMGPLGINDLIRNTVAHFLYHITTKQEDSSLQARKRACYDLNVCVPQKCTYYVPNPQSDDIKKLGLWKMIRS
jgi:hypothetical protein